MKPDFKVQATSVKGFSLLQWDFALIGKIKTDLPTRSIMLETELAELFCTAANQFYCKHDFGTNSFKDCSKCGIEL